MKIANILANKYLLTGSVFVTLLIVFIWFFISFALMSIFLSLTFMLDLLPSNQENSQNIHDH